MIAKEGRVILIRLLLITFPVGLYAHSTDNQAMIVLYAVLGLLFLFCLNFFRDPKRTIPMDASLVLSPADGKVVKVTEVNDPEVGEGAKLVSIFLNVFNVHVNRVPLESTVESMERKSGKFLSLIHI